MALSPITLFVYNRPWHTRQTIEALQRNALASESELFIYSDAAKTHKDAISVKEVRDYIHGVTGFKRIQIIERDKNWGLADSIIDGVTRIVNEYGKIIVLEDDLVTSPYFLKFMNDALDYYQNEDRVMHISGWNYPINFTGLDEVFLWRGMECWGWGTWKNRWSYFEKDTVSIMSEIDDDQRYYLNLDGVRNIWQQVLDNASGRINTWAVYWYITLILKEKLSVNPSISYVRNIGLDGSGVNCGDLDFQLTRLNLKKRVKFVKSNEENELAVRRIKHFFYNMKIKNIFFAVSKIKKRFYEYFSRYYFL